MRNADGAGLGFGETSVRCLTPQPDQVSAFAALRNGGRELTLLLINKQRDKNEAARIELKNYVHRADASNAAWQLTSRNAIEKIAAPGVSGGRVSMTLPAQSVTLLVLE